MKNIKDIIGETTDYDKKQMLEVNNPKSWCKSISAFANGKGGKLFFGIVDGTDEVVGIDNPQQAADKFSEIVKERIDPMPEIDLCFEPIQCGDSIKIIMIADVKAGSLTPYYYRGDGQLVAFQRIGNESVVVSPVHLRELVLKGSNKSYDSLSSEYLFADSSFSRLRSTFKKRTGKSFEENDYESWGIVDSNGHLTNAGALLCDDCPVLHSRIFCTRWNGLDKAHGLMDAIDDYEISGNLIDLLNEGMAFCRRNFKKKWYKTPKGRVELPDYPEDSIFEGLVNALIHRSYIELGSEVHIDMYDDRLQITSPGGMYTGKPVQDRDIMNISSSRRNPILADIFSRLRLMERRGSGFKKIVDNYVIEPNYIESLMPQFYSDDSVFELTLRNMNYPPEEEKATIKDVEASVYLDEKEYNVYQAIKINPTISNEELSAITGYSIRSLTSYTKNLRTKKILDRKGTKKARWIILKFNVGLIESE